MFGARTLFVRLIRLLVAAIATGIAEQVAEEATATGALAVQKRIAFVAALRLRGAASGKLHGDQAGALHRGQNDRPDQ